MTLALATPDAPPRKRPGVIRETWEAFAESRGAVAGLVVFMLLVIAAVVAPLIAPHDPTQQYRDAFLSAGVGDRRNPGTSSSAPTPSAATSSRA